MSLPALTVRQPWARQIITGHRNIDPRSWHTTYRGRLWIHASRAPDLTAPPYLLDDGCDFGAIIGSAELIAVEEQHQLAAASGPLFQWVFGSPVPLAPPEPMHGRLSLWHTPGLVALAAQHPDHL
jgi:hypothetical protein